MFRTLHLHARIRAICTFSFCMTLLLLFPQKAAAWSELLVKGSLSGNEGWTTIATLAPQGSDANKWSGTIDASSWKSGDQLSFKLYDSKDDNKEYWWGNGGTADMTTNSSSSVTLSNANTSGGNMTLKHNTAYSSYTLNCSYSDAGWNITITGVKNSTGGGSTGGGTSTTTVNQPGIYLYGSDFGATSSTDRLHYKFVRKNDSEYHFALYAGYMQYQANLYGGNNTDITPSWNNKSFTIAYIDADGNFSTFCPSDNYTLTNSDDKAADAKNFGSNTQWTIQDNGGMYDLVVKVDADGKPTSWHYESDANKVVAYEASSTSNWTTEGFLYCVKDANNGATYCQNFFGTIPMVKDEEFKFILGNYWFGKFDDNDPYDLNVSIANGSTDAPNLKKPYDGIYPIEFNPSRTDYQLAGKDETPLRIFMIGSALNSNLTDTYADWDPTQAVELVYDKDEQCYKGTVSLAKGKQFRFLRDTHNSGSATSLELNFGEDSNVPGVTGSTDTDNNNYVAYNDKSTSGKNITFNPETNIYNVRFYIEAGTNMNGFTWDGAKFRYTIELPARLNATITPTTATVNYAASLTPKVSVVGTTAETRKYAFTIDGSNPTIDATTGEGTGSTVVRTYTYDPVVPTNDVYTFYMSSTDQLTYIDFDGNEHTLDGNTVTVKAQAVQTLTDGSKYRLEGDIATGNYTFETAGVQPGTSYSLTVTNKEPISVNKATATVTVTNNTTNKKDDGVDVYYTTDDTDPLTSTTARLVRNRKITVYALPGTAGNAGTINVAIPSTTTSASCNYDITYSTSEGGYQNYLNNSNSQKTLGGEGHVVVYVQPYSSDNSYSTDARQAYIYAYEKKSDGTFASLTHAHRLLTDADKTTVNGKTWYALDLEPASGYKEINVQMGYKEGTSYKSTDATVANACQDMFLRFDVATGQITDVTHAHTGDHFYTIGTNGTKFEAANPASNSPFFYAQVPLTWTSNGNSVKVLSGDTELSGATVEVQNGAETSDLSSVCKVSVPTTLADKTELTLKPYKGSTASGISFKIAYQNGGYYFYESASHYSTTAPLVFSADASSDKDLRSYGRKDINHVTTGDKTYYLANSWTTADGSSVSTTSVDDNWTGSSATVNVIPAGTTISQTVTGLTASTPYTVQMIVRGKSGATGKLSLNEATNGTVTDSKSFSGYNAAGTVTTDGRVESLLSGTNNGWQKLEATANTTDDGKLTISLAATGAEMELSDVTLLENANTDGYVWTKAPTSNETTEYDLSKREKANAFSFFDRGDNKNAIVYANANTVLGMSENTYDVAVSSDGSNYTMQTLALTDQAQDGTTASGDVAKFYASGWNYGVSKDFTASAVQFDRTFSAGVKAAVCFPFALDKDKMESMFGTGAKAYTVTAVDANKMTVTAEEATSGIAANTPCLLEPGSGYNTSNKLTGSFELTKTSGVSLSASAGTGYTFEGTYDYKKVYFNETEHCYSFDPTLTGRFKYVSKSQGGIIKPFRAYIKEANTGATAKVFRLVINSTTTGLVDAELNEVSTAPIYSVTGVLVSANGNRNGLPNGVYIQDGKKFVINK